MFGGFKKSARRFGLMALAISTLGVAAKAQTTYSNIEQKTGWQSCTVCAGTAGAGDAAKYSRTPNQSSPSMDGHSTKHWLGGTNNYTNALWWKQLGANNNAHHFKYDLYFYVKNPNAVQALEFDVNQATGTKRYIFGTECSFKRGYWDVYQAGTGWIKTGIWCGKPAAYKWHHLTWEFQRTSDNKVKFVAVTLDGKKNYVNRTYSPHASGAKEINVAFQMDGDKYQTDYSVWLDKVKLTYW